ncbi:olfactory receptor 52M1-like [Rhinatrema bivittatum]|uniref:olfactory receptor 52M1-like n=1 Tax=Rhinatrema bivittatum TaxID=194408 RepID=UPI001129D96F|nr:olfactory receptor 52M1-like [Rhinatrema bivittatum]
MNGVRDAAFSAQLEGPFVDLPTALNAQAGCPRHDFGRSWTLSTRPDILERPSWTPKVHERLKPVQRHLRENHHAAAGGSDTAVCVLPPERPPPGDCHSETAEMCDCTSNGTTTIPSEFILQGFFWIQDQKLWISIPFTAMYFLAVLGNGILVLVTIIERSLHEPMYIYISLLAVIDLGLSSSVIPKVLGMLWFNANTISVGACLTQMYSVYCFEALESSVFVAMSLDRYVAICQPLRYSSIITSTFITRSIVFMLVRCLGFLSPLPYLTARLPYCNSNNISHSFCEHVALLNLTCGDLTINMIYMVVLVCSITIVDNSLIALSYLLILRAVLRVGSAEALRKAFSTCSSHIIVIVFFNISASCSFFLYMFGQNVPTSVQIIPLLLNCLVPPMVNPIVYGVRTREIRQSLKTLVKKMKFFFCYKK